MTWSRFREGPGSDFRGDCGDVAGVGAGRKMARGKRGSKKKSGLSLSQIENLLGEDFESLAQARRALSRETTKQVKATSKAIAKTGKQAKQAEKAAKKTAKAVKATKKEITKDTKQIKKTAKAVSKLVDALTGKKGERSQSKGKQGNVSSSKPTKKAAPQTPPKNVPSILPTNKRIYEMRDLPTPLIEDTFNSTLETLGDNSDAFDRLLKPGEMFAGRIGHGVNSGYTYAVFQTFQQFLDYISQYRFAVRYGDDPRETSGLLDLVQIIRYKAPGKDVTRRDTAKAWRGRKQAELDRADERREKRQERAKQRKAEKRKIQAELRQAKREKEQLEKERQAAERKLAEQRERLSQERFERIAAERKAAKLERNQKRQLLAEINKRNKQKGR